MLAQIRSGAVRRLDRFRRLGTFSKILLLLMTVVTAVIFVLVFKRIAGYELKSHAYNWDSPLYWTVGRGMLNGLKPYADLYENKPLGMFLISALSFRLTGGTILCNLASVLAALAIAVLPAWALLDDCRRSEKSDAGVMRYALSLFTVLFVGLLFAVYCEKRSGSFQSEEIGAAFSLLFIVLVKKQQYAGTRRKKVLLTAASALSVGCAVIIKEPFLLISAAGALLFTDSIKAFLKNIVLPCVFGGSMVLGVLAVTGAFVPYFTVYLRQMFATRFSSGSSVFLRALHVFRLFRDIRKVSVVLFAIVILMIFLTVVRLFLRRNNKLHLAAGFFKVILMLYTASFCAAIGGQYFNHHYVFAVPVYGAFVIFGGAFLFEYAPGEVTVNRSVLFLAVLVILASVSKYGASYRTFYESYGSLQVKAQYVDELLTYYGAERYQFIGFNNDEQFFGLTEHSPLGPFFVQDPDLFADENSWSSQLFISQLDDCDVIIVDHYPTPGIRRTVKEVIEESFTYLPEASLGVSPPCPFECDVYIRRGFSE